MPNPETIAAIASPPGRGGIGIVRISGPQAVDIAVRLLGAVPPARQAVLRSFRDERGETIDRGLSLFFAAPHSYTGEDVLELHGHGGPAVLHRLLRRCFALGARPAAPGEFTQRAFLNEKLDLVQAESVADLIDAATEEAARAAMRSLSGAFSERIGTFVRDLIDLRASVEATLDFPEEEIDSLKEAETRRLVEQLQAQVDTTLQIARQGTLLREGIHVVLAGRPNVGKSSLLNRLAGADVAIVTEIPGTTRDAIKQTLNIRGVPLHIVDTAGLRDSDDPVERLGMDRAWAAIANADIVVLVREAGQPWDGAEIVERLPKGPPWLEVINKIDLTGEPPGRVCQGRSSCVRVSALTGAGLNALEEALLEIVGWKGREEGLFMARARHIQGLTAAKAELERAARPDIAIELLAEHLRLAHRSLAGITGEFSPDDLLGEIFSRFCIGK